MDNTTEFISNSDTNENHLTSSDEKSSTDKGKENTRNFVEDSKNQEKCIVKEITTEKENADGHQNDDTLNNSALEGNTSEYVECDDESLSDEDEISSDEDEIHSYNTDTLELTVGKISENVLQVFEERSLHKEKGAVSQSTQVSGGLVDEENENFEADSHTPALENDGTFIQESDEVASRNGVTNVVVDEENKEFSTGSKMPEVQNATTSTGDSVEVTVESEGKDPNSFVDEQSKDSSTGSKMFQVQNAETSTEVSVDDDSSPNGKKLTAKQSRRSSEEITEIISKYLNSKEYMKKLDEIDEIVEQLAAEEFLSAKLSTENLSPEDMKALKELLSQKIQNLTTKRKSKLCELDEDPEDLQAISKKCKLSSVCDRPFKLENRETSCCLEEQFRIAFKETSDDHSRNSEKEYRFPLTTGNEQQRKFCKHQIVKIDAMVTSAMSLDNSMSQLPDNPNNSTEEVYEDTPCCYHTKAQSLSSARKLKDKTLSGPQKSVPEKMIADSNEECSETSDKTKWYSYFRFGGALNCIKNVILFVSFTGSLMVAMTLGKVFGVDFPVGKSKRNNTRDNSLQQYPTV